MYLNLYFVMFMLLFLISIGMFIFCNILLNNDMTIFFEYNFYLLNSIDVVLVILMDWMSILFLGVVFLISSMVIYYSKSYMMNDKNKNRFLYLIFLFVLSMMFLIISPNMISILLGWDGLGLISYCLVIYYQNVKSYNAGMLTIMSNRVGDAAILVAIAWMLNYGSFNFFFFLSYLKNDYFLYIISIMVILAGVTKSAQIPFSSWLPAAMAAPTPVSALVHSSTLVTAGVYLLIRFSPMLENFILFKYFMLMGMLTMFISGLGANFEFDLKKIIALSTLSQLGLMMTILAMNLSNLAFFHLLIHAFFKSLLFLCAGVLIHSFKDSQDIRFMGASLKFMPLTGSFFNISNLALCGLPFLAGFYSKDLILEMTLLNNVNFLTLFLCYFSTGLTVSYSLRLFYWSFLNNINQSVLINLHDEDWIMNKSMIILLIFSIIGGSFFMWMVLPFTYMIYLPLILKMLVIFIMILGVILGVFSNYLYKCLYINKSLEFFSFLGNLWFMPILSTYGLNFKMIKNGLMLKKNLDFGWTENLIFSNLNINLKFYMNYFQKLHLNFIKIYLFIFIIWILIFLIMLNMK
uniref:NADH dehydrogenase subunit 5 n=1 Tax=Goera martynowi TaxID=3399597 RepID=UPI0022DCDB93|nr:NADH dehydrogenase subunit 5 [Goera horni]UZZ43968.1 NADH dehydrogenase subunit 5 [Goera horni]